NLGLCCMDSLMLGAARFWGYTFMSPTMTLATFDITTFNLSSCHNTTTNTPLLPSPTHLFTKSTHNQKIECLWSQLMKQYNSELIDKLFHAVIFPLPLGPLLQHSLDEWKNNYKTFKHFLEKSMLSSRVKNGLVPIPPEAADTFQTEFYPDG
ncbi:hypothetical protein VP01_10743g1, partial [Puccinia sorghi]